MTDTPAWRMYERLVAAFEVDLAEMGTSVTPNASLVGSIRNDLFFICLSEPSPVATAFMNDAIRNNSTPRNAASFGLNSSK
jgi:hypothetical protein